MEHPHYNPTHHKADKISIFLKENFPEIDARKITLDEIRDKLKQAGITEKKWHTEIGLQDIKDRLLYFEYKEDNRIWIRDNLL